MPFLLKEKSRLNVYGVTVLANSLFDVHGGRFLQILYTSSSSLDVLRRLLEKCL